MGLKFTRNGVQFSRPYALIFRPTDPTEMVVPIQPFEFMVSSLSLSLSGSLTVKMLQADLGQVVLREKSRVPHRRNLSSFFF